MGESGEITQTELVERLVMGTDVAGDRLRKLVREDRIVREKKGRTRVYHPVGRN